MVTLRAEQVIYLGVDHAIDRVAEAWAETLGIGASLVEQAHALRNASAAEIARAVHAERGRLSLRRLRSVPGPGARVLEIIGDRLLLLIDDKQSLDEEDLLPASVILFGGKERVLRHIGQRTFICPGAIAVGKPGGLLLIDGDGYRSLRAALYDIDGRLISEEPLQTGTAAKLRVTSP